MATDPKNQAGDRAARDTPRVLSPAFWTMIVFAALCIAAAALFAVAAPRLLAVHAPPPLASAARTGREAPIPPASGAPGRPGPP